MPEKKRKKRVPETKIKEPNFIRFSKVHLAYINEIRRRQLTELNVAIDSIYDEMGISEKILKAPPGTYMLRQDFSGLDVRAVRPEPKKETAPEKKPESKEKALPQVISKEKGGKDN